MFVGFQPMRLLMYFLKMQSEDTIGWLSENQVIVNLDESKVIVISKKKSDQGENISCEVSKTTRNENNQSVIF